MKKLLNKNMSTIYLITLISYILILFLIQIYQIVRDYISGPLDWEFSVSMLIAGFALVSFYIFNLVFLWKFIKHKYPTSLIILTLIEFLYFPLLFILSFLEFNYLIDILYKIYFGFALKFIQLVLALILLIKIKKKKNI